VGSAAAAMNFLMAALKRAIDGWSGRSSFSSRIRRFVKEEWRIVSSPAFRESSSRCACSSAVSRSSSAVACSTFRHLSSMRKMSLASPVATSPRAIACRTTFCALPMSATHFISGSSSCTKPPRGLPLSLKPASIARPFTRLVIKPPHKGYA
jgi:hypothetical protein